MPIQTSPGVAIVEKDLSQVVTFSPTNEAVIVINAEKGPIGYPVLVSSAAELVTVFGTPNDANASAWFCAYNFLQYSNKLWVVRASGAGLLNATAGSAGLAVFNRDDYAELDAADFANAGQWVAKDPGVMGNALRVIMVDSGNWSAFVADTTLVDYDGVHYSKQFKFGKPTTTDFVSSLSLDSTQKNDELAILVIDRTGAITGRPGAILELFEGLSKAVDAIDYKTESSYFVSVINEKSSYVYFAKNPTTGLATGANLLSFGSTAYDVQPAGKSFETFNVINSSVLSHGVAGSVPGDSELITAYNTILNKEQFNISFIITAAYSDVVVKHCIQNIAEVRKDCIAFVTPHNGGKPFMNKTTLVNDLQNFREVTLNVNTSYAVMDSGFKYQFDNYGKKWRWIPLNGDVAGLCARTDSEAEPWFSPAGYNRGQIKGVTKLSSNLDEADRDVLHPKGINAVVSFRGRGTVLYGDKTLQSKASAFDRINVRRLFIILEKAIADAAKYQLFELNDEFTRAQFKTLVEPFLRSVLGRRGIQDFKVVCDTTNNTEDVISTNQFVADIYILPNYSINYITLNFIATKSRAQFDIRT